MRPFTRTHQILSGALPACAGVAIGGVFGILVTEPAWFWAVYAFAFVMAPVCWWARRHGRRRYLEIEHAAHQRGWREHGEHYLMFTKSDVDEIGRIKGRAYAEAMHALGERNRALGEWDRARRRERL